MPFSLASTTTVLALLGLLVCTLLFGLFLILRYRRRVRQLEAEVQENARLADDALRTKSLFLTNMSHEIRTPMNGIVGMASLLQKTTLSKEQHSYLETIRHCSDMLLTVINTILETPEKPVPMRLPDTAIKTIPLLADKYALRILVAEDNPINQQLAMIILNKMGYKPEVAENGKEVLQQMTRHQFDIILMDIQMPEMDGLEATQHIRNSKGHQPVIIAITANATRYDRDECLAKGMNDYLSKPVDLEELSQTISKWGAKMKEAAYNEK